MAPCGLKALLPRLKLEGFHSISVSWALYVGTPRWSLLTEGTHSLGAQTGCGGRAGGARGRGEELSEKQEGHGGRARWWERVCHIEAISVAAGVEKSGC